MAKSNTLSVDDTSEIVKTLTKRFPNIIGPRKVIFAMQLQTDKWR